MNTARQLVPDTLLEINISERDPWLRTLEDSAESEADFGDYLLPNGDNALFCTAVYSDCH